MDDLDHVSAVARRYLFEMARMIQFGGETLFVCLDGHCLEQPDQESQGLPLRVQLGLEAGKVGVFDLHTVLVRGDEVYLYMEVSSIVLDEVTSVEQENETTLRFSDGSVLTGPHYRPTSDGTVKFYAWHGGTSGDGGQARVWAQKWANHSEGISGDGGTKPH